MKKVFIVVIILIIIIIAGIGTILYFNKNNMDTEISVSIEIESSSNSSISDNVESSYDEYTEYIEETNIYQDEFEIDVVLHTENRSIHHSRYIPENIDSNEEIPLYITLPGWEGLYFQGVGTNLQEEFAFSAKNINSNMIILAPQLDDWGEQSADDTIALIEYYKEHYNISKVYANGYSGGGETMSLVMGKRADLIDAYLQVSSQWDGEFESTVQNETPVYLFIGEDDEYYGSENTKETYNTLYKMYQEKGLTDEEINEILILDVRDDEYFQSNGASNQHGGGGLVANETDIMTWLLSR